MSEISEKNTKRPPPNIRSFAGKRIIDATEFIPGKIYIRISKGILNPYLAGTEPSFEIVECITVTQGIRFRRLYNNQTNAVYVIRTNPFADWNYYETSESLNDDAMRKIQEYLGEYYAGGKRRYKRSNKRKSTLYRRRGKRNTRKYFL